MTTRVKLTLDALFVEKSSETPTWWKDTLRVFMETRETLNVASVKSVTAKGQICSATFLKFTKMLRTFPVTSVAPTLVRKWH